MIKIKQFQDLSIKNKIVAIILLVTYLCLSVGFAFIAFWDVRRIKAEKQSDLILNAKLIGDYCIVPLTFDDQVQATKALSRLQYYNYIETACLYDRDGNVFAVYPDSTDKSEILPLIDQPNSMYKNKYFYTKVPIQFNGEFYGTMFLKANSKPILAVKKALVYTISILSIVLILLSIVIAERMQRFISWPILKLKLHFDEISEKHDFSLRLTKLNNDEIGSLYEGFNRLAKQIQKHSQERDVAEANVKNVQNKLNLALQGGEIGIWEWDLVKNITFWDSKMESIFGMAEGEFNQTYEAFKACLHPDDIRLAEDGIANAIDGIAPYDIVYRVIWKTMEVKFIRAKALVLKNETGKPITMIGICIDVSTIKKAEIELRKHRNELEQLVNERTKELISKNAELEKMNHVFVGRELKMVELKKEISKLEKLLKMNG